MSSEPVDSLAVVPAAVAIDVDMANSGAADGEVQAADADAGNGGGVVLQEEEAGKEDEKAPEAVKEGDKKEARKQMDARSEMWKHYKKIFIDGVLQKGKCKYCNTDIAAHTVTNVLNGWLLSLKNKAIKTEV